jgi:hypothetical protein
MEVEEVVRVLQDNQLDLLLQIQSQVEELEELAHQ